MTHLDNGQLHAYLDGEGTERIGSERQEVERHLAECAACRGRLEEERRIRDQARAILAVAGPKGLTPPPFDAVVERAARRRQVRQGVRPTTWLAWAASVALAVAVGWFTRGLLTTGMGGAARQIAAAAEKTEQDVRVAPIQAAPPASRQVARATPSRRDLPQGAGKTTADTGAVTGLTARGEPPPANVAVAEAKAAADTEAQARPSAQPTAPTPSVAAPLVVTRGVSALRSRSQRGSITGRVVGATTRQPLSGVAVRVEGTQRETVTGLDGRFQLADVPAGPQHLQATLVGYGAQRQEVSVLAGDTASVQVAMEPATVALDEVVVTGTAAESWVTVTPSEAERRLGGPLATIPGLPSLGTAVSGRGTSTVARTMQVLGLGLTIELVQRRTEPSGRERAAAPAPAAPAGRAPGEEPGQALTVQWEGFSVTGRALVGADSLRKLLARLQAAPPLR